MWNISCSTVDCNSTMFQPQRYLQHTEQFCTWGRPTGWKRTIAIYCAKWNTQPSLLTFKAVAMSLYHNIHHSISTASRRLTSLTYWWRANGNTNDPSCVICCLAKSSDNKPPKDHSEYGSLPVYCTSVFMSPGNVLKFKPPQCLHRLMQTDPDVHNTASLFTSPA